MQVAQQDKRACKHSKRQVSDMQSWFEFWKIFTIRVHAAPNPVLELVKYQTIICHLFNAYLLAVCCTSYSVILLLQTHQFGGTQLKRTCFFGAAISPFVDQVSSPVLAYLGYPHQQALLGAVDLHQESEACTFFTHFFSSEPKDIQMSGLKKLTNYNPKLMFA